MTWSDQQIRAWEALDLGPRWQRRTTESTVVEPVDWDQLRHQVAKL